MSSHFRRYLAQKVVWYALAFFLALSLNFFLPRLIPGNPASQIVSALGQQGMVSSQAMKKMYEQYMQDFGLDQPLYKQYFQYLGNVATLDLGTSFMQFPRRVSDLIGKALPYTLAIQIPGIIVGWIIGNLLGAYAAYKGGKTDAVAFTGSLFLSSIPFYCFAIILVYTLAVYFKVFPAAGAYKFGLMPSWTFPFVQDFLRHWILPFLSMVLIIIGGQAIGMREMAIYELGTDYVNYAKGLGVHDRKVVGYVFRNAMLPQVTGLALSFGTMIGGQLIVESVFSYPGVGSLLFTAIRQNDYPMIQGVTLIITVTVLAANFLVELLYGIIDPRIRASQTGEL